MPVLNAVFEKSRQMLNCHQFIDMFSLNRCVDFRSFVTYIVHLNGQLLFFTISLRGVSRLYV